MSTTNDETGTAVDSETDDVKARLMRPMTITAPTYAFVAAGVAVLALVLVAID